MKIEFLTTDDFVRSLKKLNKKYPSIIDDLELFKDEFKQNPNVGDDLGNGYRKIRIKITSKGKGKRGGGRIITYELFARAMEGGEGEKDILLVDIYDKSTLENMPEDVYTYTVEQYLKNKEAENTEQSGK